jgi:hypothetical protein
LHRQLFESYEVREGVAPDEAARYHTANRVAWRYCAGLARRFARDRTPERIESDVRIFYRRSLADKLRAA